MGWEIVRDPLASALQQSDTVRGIHGTIEEKRTLYADDLVLFFNDPGHSLREALTILSHFADSSGLS